MSDSFHIQAISRFIIINILKILYNAKENVCIRLSCAFACHVHSLVMYVIRFSLQNVLLYRIKMNKSNIANLNPSSLNDFDVAYSNSHAH